MGLSLCVGGMVRRGEDEVRRGDKSEGGLGKEQNLFMKRLQKSFQRKLGY